jgi:hypothetical protein
MDAYYYPVEMRRSLRLWLMVIAPTFRMPSEYTIFNFNFDAIWARTQIKSFGPRINLIEAGNKKDGPQFTKPIIKENQLSALHLPINTNGIDTLNIIQSTC